MSPPVGIGFGWISVCRPRWGKRSAMGRRRDECIFRSQVCWTYSIVGSPLPRPPGSPAAAPLCRIAQDGRSLVFVLTSESQFNRLGECQSSAVSRSSRSHARFSVVSFVVGPSQPAREEIPHPLRSFFLRGIRPDPFESRSRFLEDVELGESLGEFINQILR